jgi:hypothetical protein
MILNIDIKDKKPTAQHAVCVIALSRLLLKLVLRFLNRNMNPNH